MGTKHGGKGGEAAVMRYLTCMGKLTWWEGEDGEILSVWGRAVFGGVVIYEEKQEERGEGINGMKPW